MGLVFDKKIVDEYDLEIATKLELTRVLPLDILSKLCLALINLKKLNLSLPLIMTVMDADIEDYGDVYLDIAEALADNSYYHDALILFEKLIKSKAFSLAAVWLKYADTLAAAGRLEDSIAGYRTVIELAPVHEEARLRLADLLQKLGKKKKVTRFFEH